MSTQKTKDTKTLENLKAGDWAYHIFTGWGKINDRTRDQILVGNKTYRSDGRPFANSVNPAIYPYNPFNLEEQPPFECEFKEGEVIAVRDMKNQSWSHDVFISQKLSHFRFNCKRTSWSYARKLTPAEKGEE